MRGLWPKSIFGLGSPMNSYRWYKYYRRRLSRKEPSRTTEWSIRLNVGKTDELLYLRYIEKKPGCEGGQWGNTKEWKAPWARVSPR